MREHIEKAQNNLHKRLRYFMNFYSYCYQGNKKITVMFTIFTITACIDEIRMFFTQRGLFYIIIETIKDFWKLL
jgi:hypothetical protein